MLSESFLKNGLFLGLFITMLAFWIENINMIEKPIVAAFGSQPPPSPFGVVDAPSEGSEMVGRPLPLWGQRIGAKGLGFANARPMHSRPLRGLGGASEASPLNNFSIFSLGICFTFLTSLLLFRWINSGYPPLSSLYESLLFLSWGFIGLYFLFILSPLFSRCDAPVTAIDDWHPKGLQAARLGATPTAEGGWPWFTSLGLGKGEARPMRSNKGAASAPRWFRGQGLNKGLQSTLGFVITASILFIDTFAEWQLPESMRQIKPLIPALQSNWLLMHVSIMILSYASLLLGSIFSITYLILDTFSTPLWRRTASDAAEPLRGLGARIAVSEPSFTAERFASGPSEPLAAAFGGQPRCDAPEGANGGQGGGPSETLDALSYKLLSFGFPLLTLGILSGSIWANEAWGSYWSWDPKETWAFITWLVFAFYLHTRINYSWSGRSSAYVATFGFFIVWVCYLGVNILGKGLHSYGWISS